MRRTLCLLLGLSVIATTLSVPTMATAFTVASEAKKGVVEAYAAVDTATCTLVTFGGKRVTGATLGSLCGVGFGNVTFTGKFPSDITSNKVIVNTTGRSFVSNSVTSAIVVNATPTTITIGFNAWDSAGLTNEPDTVYIAVFVGQ